MKKTNNVLSFENLSQFPELVHGYSTTELGDMTLGAAEGSLQNFAEALQVDSQKIVRMRQTHGNNVRWVTDNDAGSVLQDVDGLLTDQPNLFLGVIVRDCIPLFLYDTKKHYIGALHVGWRGLYKQIINKAISEFIDKDSNPNDIMVGIGPCICARCYDIAPDHENLILTDFPDWKPYIYYREGKIFLDLAGVAKHQLDLLGIPFLNYEDAQYCTFEHSDLFSYRRDGKEPIRQFMGLIGRKA